MLGCFCLVMCKGDWAEFCSTFGFANWQTKISPCLNCWATLANHLEDEEFGVDCVVWPDFTGDDYLEACVQSEVIVVVMDTDVLKRITQSLFYDKRKKGSFGRALRVDVATDPPLLAGYRLEPSPELLDVGSLDNLTEDDLPTKLTFWNFSQGRIKHRNPLMNSHFWHDPLQTDCRQPPRHKLRGASIILTGASVDDVLVRRILRCPQQDGARVVV